MPPGPKQAHFSVQCSFNVDDNLTTIRNLSSLEESNPDKQPSSTTKKNNLSFLK